MPSWVSTSVPSQTPAAQAAAVSAPSLGGCAVAAQHSGGLVPAMYQRHIQRSVALQRSSNAQTAVMQELVADLGVASCLRKIKAQAHHLIMRPGGFRSGFQDELQHAGVAVNRGNVGWRPFASLRVHVGST